jgi:Alpha/beta hydrolase of unknown function (DUF900)
MATSFMISNRKLSDNELTHQIDLRNTHYFVSSEAASKLTDLSRWQKVTGDQFRDMLVQEASKFPDIGDDNNEDQKHVSLFIHGYNNTWQEAVTRYCQIQRDIFAGKKGLGIPVLFTWPSNGMAAAYLPDREDARASAPQLADVFVHLHDHLSMMQRAAASNLVRSGSVEGKNTTTLCRAKVSVIAHSMGNYVMQNALAIASRKINNPQLITLIHQLVMVAADVDNDIFQTDKPGDSDGSLMSNSATASARFTPAPTKCSAHPPASNTSARAASAAAAWQTKPKCGTTSSPLTSPNKLPTLPISIQLCLTALRPANYLPMCCAA